MLGEVCGDTLYGGDAVSGDMERLFVSMVTGDELLEDTWEEVTEDGTIKYKRIKNYLLLTAKYHHE